jgi:pimeloyl-ACP methyl ester carboxylesterase
LPIPVSFYFGDIDWMLTDSGQKIVDNNPFKDEHSHVFIIERSDHHLYFDNPEGFVEAIKKDLSNQHLIHKKSDNSI